MRRLRYLLGQGQYGTRSLRYLGGEGEAHAVVVDLEAVAGVGERNSRDEVRVEGNHDEHAQQDSSLKIHITTLSQSPKRSLCLQPSDWTRIVSTFLIGWFARGK